MLYTINHRYTDAFSVSCHVFIWLASPQEREAEFRDQSESTNSRVVWWTIAQIVVLGVTCLWQMRHLKGFFEAKKLV